MNIDKFLNKINLFYPNKDTYAIEMENKNQKVPIQEKIEDIFTTEAIIGRNWDLFEKYCKQNGLDWASEFGKRFGKSFERKNILRMP